MDPNAYAWIRFGIELE